MAIKALKQTVSIGETQKMIHQWKARGVKDSIVTKLLDLYLGMPAYMNAQGVYPLCNFYDIRLSLRFACTTTLLTAVKGCQSFGLVWDETHTKIIAFYSPLWFRKEEETPQDSAQKTPQEMPQEMPQETPQKMPQKMPQEMPQDSAFDNNIIYNINNIYPPEDSREGYPAGNEARNPAAEGGEKAPSEIPPETPGGEKNSSPAAEFFHRLNATPEEKQQVLVPLIDHIAAAHHYTRPRTLQGLVILVNHFLIPHFDAIPRFAQTSHTGRIIWLQNLMKTRHGQGLVGQAIARLGKELTRGLEEKRRKLREFRPVSPFEWKDPDNGIRYYDDPIDGKVEIPRDAPPRPTETAIWNVLSHEWVG